MFLLELSNTENARQRHAQHHSIVYYKHTIQGCDDYHGHRKYGERPGFPIHGAKIA